MTLAEYLLARLEHVRARGEGKWLARCPAHDDHSPSLSIHEAEGGRVLIHCFAGCSAADIVAAVGLELSDLFPPRPENHRYPAIRRPFPRVPREVLAALSKDLVTVHIAAKFVLQEADELASFTAKDFESLNRAVERIAKVLELSGMCRGRVDV